MIPKIRLKMVVLGIGFIMLFLAAACSRSSPEPGSPSPEPSASPTEIPLLDLTITIRPSIVPTRIVVEEEASPTITPEPSPTYPQYSITSGDTLVDIASRFNTTTEAIVEVNPGIVAELLSVGQIINLPQQEIGTPEVEKTDLASSSAEINVYGTAGYLDAVGNYWVLGAVKNSSAEPVSSAKLNITIRNDATGVEISKEAFTQPDIILPGGDSAFAVLFENQNPDTVANEVDVVSFRSGISPAVHWQDLTLIDTELISEGRAIQYQGAVINESSLTIGDVVISAIFIDENDLVVGYRVSEIDQILVPGEQLAFSSTVLGFSGGKIKAEFTVHGTIIEE